MHQPKNSSSCVDLGNLWEVFPSRRFCEFCAICGRTFVCLVGALLALASGKAERRQVHPIKLAASVQICEICGRLSPAEASVNSVQSVGGLPSRRFCEFCEICGRTTVCLVGAAETAAPPEIASVQSVGGHPQQAEAIRGSPSQPPFLASLQILRVIPHDARRVGRRVQGWSRQVQGENIVRYCTENAAIETKSVKTPPPERAKLFNICKLETQDNLLYWNYY